MALTKRTTTGQISIYEFGNISLRTDTIIEDDGVEISRTYHREVLEPGASTTSKDKWLKDITAAIWTPQVVAAYEAKKAAQVPA